MKQSDSDPNHPIPYKYIDADNKIYKDPYLNNNIEDSSEEFSAKKSNVSKLINTKNINIQNLTEDEINNLILEKSKQLIELNQDTEKLKIKLTSVIKQINTTLTQNAEILYKKDPNPSEIEWLKEQLESKKKTLKIEQKINHSYKVQYKILENKLKTRNNIKESKKDINSNTKSTTINKDSNDYRTLSKRGVKVSSNLYMSVEDQINKIKDENKEILSKINSIKNKKVSQQKEVNVIINGELNNELKLKAEELQQLKFLKMDADEKYKTINKSLETMNKKIEHFEEKAKQVNENEIEGGSIVLNNYNHWLEMVKEELNNKNKEELVDLIRNGQSSFLNELKKKRIEIKKKKKNLQDGSTDMNSNNINNITKNENKDNENNKNLILRENKKKQNKNIYTLFSIINNINNVNDNKTDKNENNENNDNEKLSKLKEDKNILDDLSDIEYRELLNKKEEYLETNIRLDKNIKDFLKTENTKLSKVSKSLKEKVIQLNITKEKNDLLQDEVNNLENIYKLSLEKEKIKKEIEQKLTIQKNNESNIIEKINEPINKDNKIQKNDKNNDSNYEIDIKKKEKEKKYEGVSSKNDFPETREEQLRLIKKKYIEQNDNNNNNNYNYNNYNNYNIEEINNNENIDNKNVIENKNDEIKNENEDINIENNIEIKNDEVNNNNINIKNEDIKSNQINTKIIDDNNNNNDIDIKNDIINDNNDNVIKNDLDIKNDLINGNIDKNMNNDEINKDTININNNELNNNENINDKKENTINENENNGPIKKLPFKI